MKIWIFITWFVLIICSLLLISTINLLPVDHASIPFTTSSGVNGEIQLDLPVKVYAGDKGKIRLQLKVDTSPFGDTSAFLIHLESGIEQIDPNGLVKVKIRNSDPVSMNWVFQSYREGEYPGTLWVWLQTDGDQELVLAREIVLKSSLYLGSRVIYFRIVYAFLWVVCVVWLIVVTARIKNRK